MNDPHSSASRFTFHDTEKPRQEQFLGVAIFDVDETNGEKTTLDIVEEAWRLGINPGGAVVVCEIPSDKRIEPKYKNRLITNDALLMQLGSWAAPTAISIDAATPHHHHQSHHNRHRNTL
jgi:hypothetical protein